MYSGWSSKSIIFRIRINMRQILENLDNLSKGLSTFEASMSIQIMLIPFSLSSFLQLHRLPLAISSSSSQRVSNFLREEMYITYYYHLSGAHQQTRNPLTVLTNRVCCFIAVEGDDIFRRVSQPFSYFDGI